MKSAHVLAIKHLPSAAAELVAGGIYLLLHDESAPITELVWPTLMAACDGAQAQWVTGCDVDQLLAPSTVLAKRMRGAVNSGKVRILQKKSPSAPSRILDELDFFELERGALVVIDGAGGFLTESDHAASIARARVLTERSEVALLLLCPEAEAAAIRLERLAGVALLRHVDGALSWDTRHWFGAHGVLADVSFRLCVDAIGGFSAERIDAPAQTFAEAHDEAEVYVTRAALGGKEPPASWRVVDDLDAMEAKLIRATAATLILHFDQYTKLETLTRMVFAMRRSSGPRIKILIREVNVHLRYSQEQLLLKLGANLVVPAEVLFSRILSFVAMVQGQVYPHSLEQDYEATVAKISPSSERGYLAPKAFVAAVTHSMERVNQLMIQNALVRLPLAPGITPLIALRSCWMKRNGDFCTADQSTLYVFLFACRESDIALTLDRQFSFPVHDLFDGEVRYLTPDTIREAVHDLSMRAEQGTLADMTSEITAMEDVAERGLLSSSAEAVIHRNAPSPAIRRPLQLRQVKAT